MSRAATIFSTAERCNAASEFMQHPTLHSTTTPPGLTGGQLLVRCLREQQVTTAFCVPGESYLDVLDGLYTHRDAIALVVCRHEAGAANMAEAYGKLTGAPGVCFVTRGPGATHASAAVHTAFEDATPMVLFIGQVATAHRDREAFQEIDYRAMFGGFAKWVAQIDAPERVSEYVARAFNIAVNGRPGPVVLALPEDMLGAPVAALPAPAPTWQRLDIAPPPQAMAALLRELGAARAPLLIVGGGGWTPQAREDLARFAQAQQLPVVAEFRCQDYLDNRHPCYAGDLGLSTNPALAQRVRDSDLVVLAGGRLSEALTAGYALLGVPRPRQRMVHIHASAEELGGVYHADLRIVATPPAFLHAAAALPAPAAPAWSDWTQAARADYQAFVAPTAHEGAMNMAEVVATLDRQLPEDAILTNGAGNYTTWLHRHFRYKGFRSQLAPMNGAMGYGLPAAIAAKLVHPERPVVCLAGDGCLLMNVQELETAVRLRAAIVVVVVRNGSYGTIRAHQEKRFPGRNYATDLGNPDYVALALAFGCGAERIASHHEFPEALARALRSDRPYLIDVPTDIEYLSAQSRLSVVQARARAAQAQ